MSSNKRPVHQKLLVASYILASVSTLLGALAAIGATIEQGKLEYPPVNNGPMPVSTPPKQPERKYFDL